MLAALLAGAHGQVSSANPSSPSLPTRVGRVGVEAAVPVIDIAPLLRSRRNVEDNAAFRRVAEEIVAAGRAGSAGFFTIIKPRPVSLHWPVCGRVARCRCGC